MQHYDPDLRCVWTTRPAPNSQLNCHSILAGRVRRLLSSAAVVFLLRLLSDGFLYSHAGVNGGRRCSFWDRCGEFLQKTTQMFLRVRILERVAQEKWQTNDRILFCLFLPEGWRTFCCRPVAPPLRNLASLWFTDTWTQRWDNKSIWTFRCCDTCGVCEPPPLPCPALPS